MRKWPTYVWTACGGIWFSIWMTSGHTPALFVSVGCLAVAGLTTILEELT